MLNARQGYLTRLWTIERMISDGENSKFADF